MAEKEVKSMNLKTDFWLVTWLKQQDKIQQKFQKGGKSTVAGMKADLHLINC